MAQVWTEREKRGEGGESGKTSTFHVRTNHMNQTVIRFRAVSHKLQSFDEIIIAQRFILSKYLV